MIDSRKRAGTVRISDRAHGTLRELAHAEGTSLQALLDEAIEMLRRRRFLEQVNAAYAALRGNPRTWAEIEQERSVWDGALLDGLAVHEPRERYGARPKRSGPIDLE